MGFISRDAKLLKGVLFGSRMKLRLQTVYRVQIREIHYFFPTFEVVSVNDWIRTRNAKHFKGST